MGQAPTVPFKDLAACSAEVRQIVKDLVGEGWTYRMTTAGHILLLAPDGSTSTTMPRRFKDNRGRENSNAFIQRYRTAHPTPKKEKTVPTVRSTMRVTPPKQAPIRNPNTDEEEGKPKALPQGVTFAMVKASQARKQKATDAVLDVLAAIKGPITIATLAKRSGVSQNTTLKNVRELAADGLVVCVEPSQGRHPSWWAPVGLESGPRVPDAVVVAHRKQKAQATKEKHAANQQSKATFRQEVREAMAREALSSTRLDGETVALGPVEVDTDALLVKAEAAAAARLDLRVENATLREANRSLSEKIARLERALAALME